MKIVLYILFLCVFSFVQADTIAVTENDPITLVEGVSVITGDLYAKETDIVVQGVEPIRISRSYVSQKGRGYWEVFSYHLARYSWDPKIKALEITEPSGTVLLYKGKRERSFSIKDLNTKGMTNTARGSISGKYNLKNQHIEIFSDINPPSPKVHSSLVVFCADGTKRTYKRVQDDSNLSRIGELFDKKPKILSHTKEYFLLIEEELPNGNKLLYEWPKNTSDPWMIRSCNPGKNITYAWAKFYSNQKGGRSNGDYGIETSDGRHLEYYHFSHKGIHQLKKVSGDEKPEETIDYLTCGSRQLISKISWPQGRYKEFTYYLPGELYNGVPIKKYDEISFRVKQIFSPIGENGEKVATHTFLYDLSNKKTTVLDAYGVPTIYSWNDDLRPIAIERFHKEGVLYNKEHFTWGENGTSDETNLLCKVLFDSSGEPLHAVHFFYDQYGNAIEKVFYGDLTGEGNKLSINKEGFPEDSCDTYTKAFTYSQDGKHLLLSEAEDNGCTTTYSYHKNTSLLDKEEHYDKSALQWTKTYKYDDHNNLILEETKDLKGSTDRSTGYLLKSDKDTYAGMPKIVEESMGGQLLTKTLLRYGKGGRIEIKEVYDGTKFCYAVDKKYDSKGCLEKIIDPMGYETHSLYDELHNKIFHRPFGKKTEVTMEYDRLNNLCSATTIGEGRALTRRYKYNYLNQKIEFQNEYGFITKTYYDSFGNLIESHHPDGDGTRSVYNGAGCEIAKTDAKGYTTYFFYNAYGKPTLILYPDGSQESFRYYTSGLLHVHTDQNGMGTTYFRDGFGRVLCKQTPYTVEQFSYDSFNLISATDPEGHTTTFAYDKAGRKILEQLDEYKITREYNSFGRVIKETCGDLVTHKEYDFLNRVVKEEKKDTAGNLLQKTSFAYELATDYKTVIRKEIDGQVSEERIEYNAFDDYRFTWDPLGFKTEYVYEASPHRVTITDPLGLRTSKTYNAKNLLATEEQFAKNGESLLYTTYDYDQNDNLEKKESFFNNTSCLILREYDAMNRLVLLDEGLDKITKYSYTKTGLLETIKKPSGVVITNTYSDLGFIQSKTSSDGTIAYSYDYDLNGNLINSKGNGVEISRIYDEKNNLIEERFSTGAILKNTYDKQNRRVELALHDGSTIRYDYDAFYLRQVSRIQEGVFQYAHRYREYDLSGNAILEELPFNLGFLRRTYDLANRLTLIDSPFFTQKDTEFDAVGNVTKTNRQGEIFTYTYDALYQLTEEKEHTYAFDAQNNRLRKDSTLFAINALNQTSELDYDRNGTPKFLDGKALFYDALDRLIGVNDGQCRIVYAYDALDRRLSKKVYLHNSLIEEVYYLFDGQKEIGSFDASGNIKELRVLGNTPMLEIASAISLELNQEIYIPSHDLFGNVSSLYSPSKNTLEQYTYTAFGEELFLEKTSPWRFSSKRTDEETDLVYYGNRYYCPSIGRFLTPDPLGLEAGPNLYQYVLNNPFKYTDPTGEFAFLIPLFFWGAELALPSLATLLTPLIYTTAGALTAYVGIETIKYLNDTSSHKDEEYLSMQRVQKKHVDERLPIDPLNDPNFEDIGHPKAKEMRHHDLKDKRTGEIIRYDEGKSGMHGHKGHDHYHRLNPESQSKKDYYLDEEGKPVGKYSEESHLYPPQWVWWE